MQPYWITTDKHGLGVGITASSDEDAIALCRAAWPDVSEIITIRAVSDMREIDQNHVAPNMGNWFKRGIWYPLGYDRISN